MLDFEADKTANYIKMLLDQVSELTTRVKQLEAMQQGIGNVPLGIPFMGRFNAIAPPKTYIVHVTSLDTSNQRFFGFECKPQNSATTPWTANSSLGLLTVKYPHNQTPPTVNDFAIVQYTGTYWQTIATPVYGYVDKGGSTDLIRFSLLNTLTLDSTATANILTWSSTQFTTGETIVVAADVLQGIWGPAKIGARGWAIRLQDRNAYEVLFMQRMAALIDVTLTTGVGTDGGAAADLVDFWRGYAPTSVGQEMTVKFPRHLSPHYYGSGDAALAHYDEYDNIYRVIDADQRPWASRQACGDTEPSSPFARVTWFKFGPGLKVDTITSGICKVEGGVEVSDSQDGSDQGPYRVPLIDFGAMIIISSVTSCSARVGVRTFHTAPRTFTFITTVYCSGGLVKGGIQTGVFNEHGMIISMNSPSYP